MESEYNIIGAGGFGQIFEVNEDKVIKAIHNKNICGDSSLEFNKQKKAYIAFQKIKNVNFNDCLLDEFKDKIMVSKPINYGSDEIKINNSTYACHFTMTRLRGIPIKIYEELLPGSTDVISDDFDDNFEIMCHLSLNTELKEKFYGTNYSKTSISIKNPPRGFFINDKTIFLSRLLQKFNKPKKHCKLPTDNDFKILIGFIYGVLYFGARLLPIDVEITFGDYNGVLMLNVLDFGLTIDLDDLDNAPKTSNNSLLLNLAHGDNTEELEIELMSTLSLDLYCDTELNKDCIDGWEIAKSLY